MATSRGIRSNSLELVADSLLADFCREHPDLRHRPVRGVKVVVAAYQDPSHANMKQLVNCCALPHLTPARLFSPAWTANVAWSVASGRARDLPGCELVTHPPYGLDQFRPARVGLDLRAEPPHMNRDRVR